MITATESIKENMKYVNGRIERLKRELNKAVDGYNNEHCTYWAMELLETVEEIVKEEAKLDAYTTAMSYVLNQF